VGLKSDGTVVAVGDNAYGQCDVGGWTDIVRVAAGLYHTVGVESDGTLVAVGDNTYGQCDVGGWRGISQVAAGTYHSVGVKSDGTVVAAGDNAAGQCNVGDWTGISQVAAGAYHTVGLGSNGTVVAVGLETELSKWNLWVTGPEEVPPGNWPSSVEIIAVALVVLAILFLQRKRSARTARFV